MAPRPRQSAPAPAGSTGAPGAQAREVEWQLAAPDLGAVQRWLQQHPVLEHLSIEPLPPQELHDTYLDTEDWRVLRAGFALRLRARDGRLEATLKGLSSARRDVADRREISEPLSRGGVKALAHAKGPVGTRVRDVTGVKPLRTLFEVRNSRQRFAVRSRHSGAAVGEVALDDARFVRADGRRPLVLTRVELEAASSDLAPLERLAERLRSECGLHPATENKFAVGLRAASLEPPRLRELGEKAQASPAIEASTRTVDFALAALRRLLDEWRALEPAARLGESPEALHALRVTGRRMDTVLGLFEAHLPAGLRRSRPGLKRLLDILGAVRDVDIRLEAAGKFRDALPEGDRRGLDPLLRQLGSERGAARAGMLRALDGKAARQWLDTLSHHLARPVPMTSASSRHAAALSVVPGLIRRRYRKLRQCAHRLTADSPLGDYHEMRLRTKKLRYALEIVARTYARPADDMLAALLKLQGRLGTQHDAGAVAAYLTQLAIQPPPRFTPQTLFLMGKMAEKHAHRAARFGSRVGKSWRKVRGKRWKALRARMGGGGVSGRDARGNGIDRDDLGARAMSADARRL
jgi:CHAD domain-containing protein